MAAIPKKHNCYCAFCKTPRFVYRRRSLSLTGLLGCAMGALVLTLLMFRQLDPRFFVILAFFWGVGEAAVKIRWRMSVLCKVCHFDPVLYIKNPEIAAEKVRVRLDERTQDPQYLLARPLDIPKISSKKSQSLREKGKGTLVSRSI